MRLRSIFVGILAAVVVLAMSIPALAGNPHFVGDPTFTPQGNNLLVEGKVAGLGNEPQIFVAVDALAECVNRGNKKPSADNKDEVSAGDTFPVQNGKADFSLLLDGGDQIDPSCSPPMRIVYTDINLNVFLTDANGNPVGNPVLTFYEAGPIPS